jgi:hypothetical protein
VPERVEKEREDYPPYSPCTWCNIPDNDGFQVAGINNERSRDSFGRTTGVRPNDHIAYHMVEDKNISP